MNPNQLARLASAVNSVCDTARRRFEEDVRKCPQMSGQIREYCDSNPTRRAALRPRQYIAMDLLLSGRSMSAAARLLGVNEKTVRRWMHDPCFQAELERRADVRNGPEMSGHFSEIAGTNPNPPRLP